MTLLQHHIAALTLSAIATFGVGLIVFLAEPKKRLNQVFGLYTLSIGGWSTFEALLVGAHDQTIANIVSTLSWTAAIFIAPTFLHTALLAIGQIKNSDRIILKFSYGIINLISTPTYVPPTSPFPEIPRR